MIRRQYWVTENEKVKNRLHGNFFSYAQLLHKHSIFYYDRVNCEMYAKVLKDITKSNDFHSSLLIFVILKNVFLHYKPFFPHFDTNDFKIERVIPVQRILHNLMNSTQLPYPFHETSECHRIRWKTDVQCHRAIQQEL